MMANVKRCDRCGKIYDSYKHADLGGNGVWTTIYDARDETFTRKRYFDLCQDCMDELNKFLKNEPI